MDCESPQQLRNAHPNQPVSLGYTRQQVRAPLPHSSSTDGSERLSAGGWSAGDVQIQSPPSLRGQSTSSATGASSRSSQNRLSMGNYSVSPQHITAQARHLGMPTVVPMPSVYDAGAATRQTAATVAVAPPVAVPLAPMGLLLPEATQTGSMNMPLYGAQAGLVYSGAQTAVADGLQQSVYQAVPVTGGVAMHHLPVAHLQAQAQAAANDRDRERSSREEHVTSLASSRSTGSAAAVAGGSNHVVRTSATASAVVNERADDSPMMGIVVQQSPVASH